LLRAIGLYRLFPQALADVQRVSLFLQNPAIGLLAFPQNLVSRSDEHFSSSLEMTE
jgi:hypothetical protein